MITNILISAIGKAIFESCGQALVIYIALQLFMHLFPGIGSKYRYRINYLALTAICGWFLINLVSIYTHAVALSNYKSFMYPAGMVIPVHIPTLLQQAETFIAKYAGYITGLYLMGLMLNSFRLLGGLVNIHYIRNQKNLTADSYWTEKIRQFGKQLNISKKVSLYFSEHVQIPLTIGHLKPIIIFPIALINNLDIEQVEAILLHELAHINRHDYLFNILQCIMETILCFNPFAWLLSKAIRNEREYCCDDIVINSCNNYTYAKALFIIAQQNNQRYTLAMASTGDKKYPLLNRIKRLNTMKTTDSLPKFHLLVIIAIAVIGILLTWGIPQYGIAKTAVKAPRAVVYSLYRVPATISARHGKRFTASNQKRKAFAICTDNTPAFQANDSLRAAKSKFKIVSEDENGNKKEYNSVEELPEADREAFLKDNPTFGNLKGMDSMNFKMQNMTMTPEWKSQMENVHKMSEKMSKQFNSPKWKKQMARIEKQAKKMSELYNSPEFKKQQEAIQSQALAMSKQFNSEEWSKQEEDWNKNSEEWKRQAEDIDRKMNSPEFKGQREVLKKQAEAMRKQVNSPEFKRQMAEIKKQAAEIGKQFNSPEWKKQMEDMQKKIQDEVHENMKKAEQDSVKTPN